MRLPARRRIRVLRAHAAWTRVAHRVHAHRGLDVKVITIERSRNGRFPVDGWTVAFDGTTTALTELADAMHFAAELGRKSWMRHHRAVSIVVREGETVTEIGRLEPGGA